MRKETVCSSLGCAEISPPAPVSAGAWGYWDIVFVCGDTRLGKGAALRFEIPYGFSPPQITYPSAAGYCTAAIDASGCRAELSLSDPITGARAGVWGLYVFATIVEGRLEPGSRLTLHYGGDEAVPLRGEGAEARDFEGPAFFAVSVDPTGDRKAAHGGFYLLSGEPPQIEIVSAPATGLRVVLPSVAAGAATSSPVATVDARIRATDTYGNWARRGVESIEPVDDAHLLCMAGGAIQISVPIAESPHRQSVKLSGAQPTFRSNPCVVRDTIFPNAVYWGDLHVMTVYSCGIGTPADAFAYARECALLDFCAVTDGDDADGYLSDDEWGLTQEAVRAHYQAGDFVTFLGYEYHERHRCGDKNIIYARDAGELLRWSDLPGTQPEALWNRLAESQALTIPHHTVSGSAHLQPWDAHDERYQRLVEIYSVWGSSEGSGCPRPNFWRNNYANSVRVALGLGYRLGITASGDSHDGRPGASRWLRVRHGYPGGLTAVVAPELTREAVFEALYNRYCYGSTGARILLSFTLNGHPMGSELHEERDRIERRLDVSVIAEDEISELIVIRNGTVIRRWQSGMELRVSYVDADPFEEAALRGFDGCLFLYYYVRVKQEDGELAWSSPIWVSESPRSV